MVIGPSGSGLADVKITAAVFGQEAPVLHLPVVLKREHAVHLFCDFG